MLTKSKTMLRFKMPHKYIYNIHTSLMNPGRSSLRPLLIIKTHRPHFDFYLPLEMNCFVTKNNTFSFLKKRERKKEAIPPTAWNKAHLPGKEPHWKRSRKRTRVGTKICISLLIRKNIKRRVKAPKNIGSSWRRNKRK